MQFHRHLFGNRVGLIVRNGQRASDVADGCAGCHGTKGDDLRDVVGAILSRYVLDDLGTAHIAEVDVDIGHGHAFRVEEAFEVQRILNRVKVGDAKAVRYNGTRCRTTSGADRDTVALGVMDKVRDDEEVIDKAHLVDHVDLIVQSLTHRAVVVRVSLVQSFQTQLVQIFPCGISVRYIKLRQVIFSELEFYLTAVCNLDRARNGIRVGRKERKHLLFRLDVKLARLKLHAGGVVHRLAHLNGHQHILNAGIFTGQIVRVIGRNQRNAGLVRQTVQTHIDFFLCLDAVILNFQKEIILSENLTELECLSFGALIVAIHQRLRNGTGQTGRQADQSLAVFAQQVEIDTGADIKALGKTQADHVNEVAVALHVLTQQN